MIFKPDENPFLAEPEKQRDEEETKETDSLTGGASSVNAENTILNARIEKLMYPDEIAGVKRGKPMSFEDVLNKGVNPSYDKTAENNIADSNCNSCVVAYLYNRRGYAVDAASTLNNNKAEELSHNGLDIWLDPESGEISKWTIVDISVQTIYNYLNKTVKQGEIYELAEYPQLIEDDPTTIEGHVVVVERGKDNQLKIYDPQKREIYLNNEQVKMYLDSWIDNSEAINGWEPKVIRIDNKQLNPYYEDVLVPRHN